MTNPVSPNTKMRRDSGMLVARLLESLKGNQALRPGHRVGVAVSGGADSVALLLLLLEIREKLGIVLSVVHFNHKLRGGASDTDEKFVAKLAAKYELALHFESGDITAKARKEKSNLEDAGRRARYAFFSRLVAQGELTHIAVAHTADDQAETVLAHILRGTGIAGLGGIHPLAGDVIRPLLRFRRPDLRAYLKKRKQAWREDASNRDTTRLRARIRKKLMPLLEKQFQPAVVEHLASLSELARDDESLLQSVVEDEFLATVHNTSGTARIGVKVLLAGRKNKRFNAENRADTESWEVADALAKRLLRRIVLAVKKIAGQLGARHVETILDLAKRGQNGKELRLPGGVAVRRERDELVFFASERREKTSAQKKTDSLEFAYNIDMAGGDTVVQVTELRCAFRLRVIDWPPKRGETRDSGTVLGLERLRLPMVLRNWRHGDRLQPVGHANTRKLKRLLNQKRISKWERAGWPVLTCGGVVAWARGFPVARDFAANERTQAGIVIAEEKL